MPPERVSRPGVRAGYDLWAETYDGGRNPLVALDRLHTFDRLRPQRGERILDAGCGTGVHLRRLVSAGSRPLGIDLSRGMLRVAQRAAPGVPLAQADLNRGLPVRRERFDAVLCALVSEHLEQLRTLVAEAFAVLKRGGRLVFSAFHPELAAAGIEANFERDGTEYRLGAELYSVDDYLNHIGDAGFRDVSWREFRVDAEVVERIPAADKYFGHRLLLIIEAARPVR